MNALAHASTRRPLDTALHRRSAAAVLGVLLVLSTVFAISAGATSFSASETMRFLTAAITGGSIDADDHTAYTVVWDIRTPRVLLAAIVGAGLGLLGVATQAMVRNALADPFILGVSSGASVGASAVVSLGLFAGLGMYALSAAAFLGALAASAAVHLCARSNGGVAPMRLVLTGVVLAYGFQSLMSLIVFVEPRGDAARTVMFWLMGSLGAAAWSAVPVAAAALVFVAVWLGRHADGLDVMALGDATAHSSGVDCDRLRLRLFVLTAVGTGALVAVSGAIGFVGLVVPHVVRLVVGPRHRAVLTLAPLVGALFLVWVDLLSRVLVPPRELPLGVMTAVIGVPVFLHLIRRRAYTFGGSR
ncbi:FecCD family ABC transporter permease [Luteipulveratus halotolerans]|uniref:Sugar ABC transporter substrate-binding protein n=1 Tax=Luteipulveratus halotolerans TaxID=1631356 RepID=A0A0L6CN05_9MICO|nr:iron ABC transporter permease [Luteipulveratus halotolerans]KNX38928.1 sugar ABC transporter substrate-binding protein [Luteipulveratus halotolerans]